MLALSLGSFSVSVAIQFLNWLSAGKVGNLDGHGGHEARLRKRRSCPRGDKRWRGLRNSND